MLEELCEMSSSDLNMALTDLRSAEIRSRALSDMALYLNDYDLSQEERAAVLEHDWAAMWRLGASTYAMNKLRHICRIDHDELWTVWRGGNSEDLESFLAEQDSRNAAYALPIEEVK